jgi:hypothetical protein
MIVLETLQNDDPGLRRIGETWMRCSLKSYLRCVSLDFRTQSILTSCRVLDPILYELFDPAIRRSLVTSKLRGKELQGFVYEQPFDQRYVNHLLELVLAVARFGGQGFAKTARTTAVRRSQHTGLIQRIDACKIAPTWSSTCSSRADLFKLASLTQRPLTWMS